MDPFSFLPDDIVIEIALREPIRNITELCQSSTRFNNLICNNNAFWRQKFIQDSGEINGNIISWKEAYQNYGSVVVFGRNQWGQLGLGDNQDKNTPTLLTQIKAKSVDCGKNHTIIIDLSNNVGDLERMNMDN